MNESQANMNLRGMFINTHLDCPAFRGMTRDIAPQWLLSVMHQSGLFDQYRLPVANAIMYLQDLDSGGFVYYPNGKDGAQAKHPIRRNNAVMIDADSCWHGVDFLKGEPVPELATVDTVMSRDDGSFDILAEGQVVSTEAWEDMRYSVLWKVSCRLNRARLLNNLITRCCLCFVDQFQAYCFKTEEERRVWRDHLDDLDLTTVMDTLMTDMRERGVLDAADMPRTNHELVQLMVATYMSYVPVSETRKCLDEAVAAR
jgi:hypothetical protein